MRIDNQYINAESRKRWIEMLQKQLIRENPSALPDYGVDGSYGPETTDWVSRFQERKGLEVDGLAGPETLGRLREDIVQLPGTTGRGVEILQEDLLFFYIEQSAVDGSYGAGTEQGVRDFQYYNNLLVDGEAGPDTLKKMDELLTKLFVSEGDTGSLVRRIQNQLNEQDAADISIDVDGIYGQSTKSAIEDYQNESDLYVDGVTGPRTMYILNAENSPLFTNGEMEEELEKLGLTFNDSSDDDLDKFRDIFRNHPEIMNVMDGDNFDNIYATEMDYPDGTEENEVVVIVADVVNKPNLAISGQFFKQSEELKTFAKSDIFGNLPDDDVEIKTYTIDDNDVSIETITERNVDLEDSLLQSQITFQEALQESRVRESELIIFGCNNGVVLRSQRGISTQDWTDIIGITCNIAISVSGNVLGSHIAATFGLATGPLGVTAIITTAIAAIGSYYFCSWLEGQF
ncbi:peptidoglycan-binding domain-containing protein [Virgibacillus natechei]